MKILSTLLVAALAVTSLHAAPKKLLVVTTTTGFRHSSIPTLEKELTQLSKDSGAFTVDFVQQPPGEPAQRRGATPEERQAYADARMKFLEAMTNELQKLAPENLKNYDGVVFASTTGDLPIPDPQGLLDWIKAGHAFIGIHAASDTFHHWPGYIDMLGGEFDHHGAQLSVECLNEDPQNPATASLGKTWTLTQEEVYQFKNYDPAKVHELLILDKKPQAPFTPGHYPVSWCKSYGDGKVFYTSLGHREDIIDPDPNLPHRVNSVEISKAYDAHILGGIEWALGLKTSGSVQ
ncbi:MAG TPA: ThuA domain-containing protein [Verrucomicrobiae bacterium]